MSARLSILVDGHAVAGDEAIQAILQVLVAVGLTGDIRGSGRDGSGGISFNVPSLDGVRRVVRIDREREVLSGAAPASRHQASPLPSPPRVPADDA